MDYIITYKFHYSVQDFTVLRNEKIKLDKFIVDSKQMYNVGRGFHSSLKCTYALDGEITIHKLPEIPGFIDKYFKSKSCKFPALIKCI